jgi:hypothetical protein
MRGAVSQRERGKARLVPFRSQRYRVKVILLPGEEE